MYCFILERLIVWGDLIDRVGEDAALKAWRGKLTYFENLTTGEIFGVGDYETDYIFEKYDVR